MAPKPKGRGGKRKERGSDGSTPKPQDKRLNPDSTKVKAPKNSNSWETLQAMVGQIDERAMTEPEASVGGPDNVAETVVVAMVLPMLKLLHLRILTVVQLVHLAVTCLICLVLARRRYKRQSKMQPSIKRTVRRKCFRSLGLYRLMWLT